MAAPEHAYFAVSLEVHDVGSIIPLHHIHRLRLFAIGLLPGPMALF
jgi:hypothetical protein